MGKFRSWHAPARAATLIAAAAVWTVPGCERGTGVGSVPEGRKEVVRIATFNVDGLPESPAVDDAEESRRLEAIGGALRRIDADIIALQDVESLRAVEWLRDTYLADLGYEYVASLDVGHERGAENAVLSRYPITDAKVWPDARLPGEHPDTIWGEPNRYAGQPLRFRRSPLMVEIEIAGFGGAEDPYRLTLFNVEHKGGDEYDYWRAAEAQAVLYLVGRLGEERNVLVLGSFHAEKGSVGVDTYLDNGFKDILRKGGETKRWVTEASGDRTDLILANGAAEAEMDEDAGFVLGTAADESMAHLERYPVVAGLRPGG